MGSSILTFEVYRSILKETLLRSATTIATFSVGVTFAWITRILVLRYIILY
jgi:hypothetical protein